MAKKFIFTIEIGDDQQISTIWMLGLEPFYCPTIHIKVSTMLAMQITKNRQRIRVRIQKFRFGDLHIFQKRKFQLAILQLSKYQMKKMQKYCKHLKIQYILKNIRHVLCNISFVQKFFHLVLFFGLCSLVHVPLL